MVSLAGRTVWYCETIITTLQSINIHLLRMVENTFNMATAMPVLHTSLVV